MLIQKYLSCQPVRIILIIAPRKLRVKVIPVKCILRIGPVLWYPHRLVHISAPLHNL